jgi:NTE family protein
VTLERELSELGDARVAAVGPEAAIEVFGLNIFDQALGKPAFETGRAQSGGADAEIRMVWNA